MIRWGRLEHWWHVHRFARLGPVWRWWGCGQYRVSLTVVVVVTAALLCFAWFPVSHTEWQGPEIPPCAADYLVVC